MEAWPRAPPEDTRGGESGAASLRGRRRTELRQDVNGTRSGYARLGNEQPDSIQRGSECEPRPGDSDSSVADIWPQASGANLTDTSNHGPGSATTPIGGSSCCPPSDPKFGSRDQSVSQNFLDHVGSSPSSIGSIDSLPSPASFLDDVRTGFRKAGSASDLAGDLSTAGTTTSTWKARLASDNDATEPRELPEAFAGECKAPAARPPSPKRSFPLMCSKMKHGLRQASSGVAKSICLASKKVRQWLLNCWCRFCHFISIHPKLSLLILISSLLFILTLLLLIFLVIIPAMIQKALDQTVLSLARAMVTEPAADHFTLFVESRVNRNLATAVTLRPFMVDVMYSPSPPFDIQYRRATRKAGQASVQAAFSDRHVNLRALSYQMEAPTDFSFTEATDPLTGWPHGGTPLVRGRLLQDAASPRTPSTTTVAPLVTTTTATTKVPMSSTRHRYVIGRMTLPELFIQGFSSLNSYTTRFEIVDGDLFNTFLREFIVVGRADWEIVGAPAVTVMGLTYKDKTFDKHLEIKGPRLHVTEDEFLRSLNGSEVSERPGMKSGSLDPAAKVEPLDFEISSFDLTSSTSDAARIELHVVLNNTRGLAVINPVGEMTILTKFRGNDLVVLRSDEATVLRPGRNLIELAGTIDPIMDVGDSRSLSLTELFSMMFRGETPVLETQGVTCSTPLFAPAIEAIHVYTELRLSEAPASPTRVALPIIRDMQIEELELIQDPDEPGRVEIRGRILALIANPLGPEALLDIPFVKLDGVMLVSPPESISVGELSSLVAGEAQREAAPTARRKIADFQGILEGVNQTQVVYTRDGLPLMSKIGRMKASTQSIQFEMSLMLKLTNEGEGFKEFVHSYIQQDTVEFSLSEVTASIQTESVLGPLTLIDVPMDNDLAVRGFNGLKDVRLAEFSLDNFGSILGMLTAPTSSDGFGIHVSVLFSSDAPAHIDLGRLNVDLRTEGSHLAFLSAPDCSIGRGDNFFNFTGRVKLAEIELGALLPFVRDYIAGRPNTVEVNFLREMPPSEAAYHEIQPDETPAPSWLADALASLSLKMQIPGAKIFGGGNGTATNTNGTGGGGLFGLGLFGRHPAPVQDTDDAAEELIGQETASREVETQPPQRSGLLGNLFSNLLHGFHFGSSEGGDGTRR